MPKKPEAHRRKSTSSGSSGPNGIANTSNRSPDDPELEYEFRRMEYAFARAAHFARRKHKFYGVPLVVCDKNGKVIEIPPEKIVVGPDPALNPPKRPKPATTKTRRSTKKQSRR